MVTSESSPEEQPLGSNYVLLESLGQGAMGQVWHGRSRQGEEYAIKILRPELTSDATTIARFIQEADLLKKLNHPNLVQVHDLVAEGRRIGIVMERIDGGDLRTALNAQGTLPPAEAVRLITQIAEGLGAVHAAGIVHRDLKPENVLLNASGEQPDAKISDFGISRIIEEGPGQKSTAIIGTPEYMAPELGEGETPTPQTDLYALGIMLYELCAGVTPFAGGAPLAVLRRHASAVPVKPTAMPQPVWDIVERLLRKQPSDRPANSQELVAALGAAAPLVAGLPAMTKLEPANETTWLSTSDPTKTMMVGTVPTPATEAAATRRPRWFWPVIIGGVALLLIAGGGVATALLMQGKSASAGDASITPAPTATTASSTPTPSSSPSASASPTPSASPAADMVPAVTGMTLSSATDLLTKQGFTITVKEVPDDSHSDMEIIQQSPAAGSPSPDKKVTLSVARKLVGTWLSDMTCVEGSVGGGAATINAKEYAHSVHPSYREDKTTCQFDLKRASTQLSGTAGLLDDSRSDAVIRLELLLDGRPAFSKDLKLGESFPVKIDTTGALRLTFSATILKGEGKAALGDAQLLGKPSDSATASPSPTNS